MQCLIDAGAKLRAESWWIPSTDYWAQPVFLERNILRGWQFSSFENCNIISPLVGAIMSDNHHKVQILLNAGADPSLKNADQYNITILHEAARWSNEKVVRTLLDAGVDPCQADDLGFTPLHVAASRGNKHIIKALCDGGADVDAETLQGIQAESFVRPGKTRRAAICVLSANKRRRISKD